MPPAIALDMTTFAFLLADAVFSLSSVLIIDGGEVLAVQKFMRRRRGACCVHFLQALVAVAAQQCKERTLCSVSF